jgi:hypothetical protein
VLLSPDTPYFIVLTAATTVADGAYEWSVAGAGSYAPADGWKAPLGVTAIDNYQSNDGSNWNILHGSPQFAINATAVPEPSTFYLIFLGSGVLFYTRKIKGIRSKPFGSGRPKHSYETLFNHSKN